MVAPLFPSRLGRVCLGLLILPLEVFGAEHPPVSPKVRAVTIDPQVEIGYGLAIADVNGDKKPDIVLADKNVIVWYENPAWTKHVIAEKLTQLDHVCIAAADIDGDGKAEIAAGAGWNPSDTLNSGSVHYLLPPPDRKGKWEPVDLPHEPTVHRMRWLKNPSGKYDLLVVPLHGKGNKDGKGNGVRILLYRPPADPRSPWATELVDDTLHMTHNFQPVQWGSGPGEDFLLAAREGVFLISRHGSSWSREQFGAQAADAPGWPGAGEVRLGKLGSGQRFLATIEPMHGTAVVVYRAAASNPANIRDWRRDVIDESLKGGHAVACGDLAGAGSDQIVVGWREKNAAGKVGIICFTARDKEGKGWDKTVIDDDGMACEDLVLADLNNDRKLDIIAAGRASKNLKIYFNETSP